MQFRSMMRFPCVWTWPVVAAILALMVISHDVAMAASSDEPYRSVDVAAMSSHTHSRTGHGNALQLSHPTLAPHDARDCLPFGKSRLMDCGVARFSHPIPAQERSPTGPALHGAAAAITQPRLTRASALPAHPHESARMRRALLQVFLN